MWIEELANGKYKYFERYTDPMSLKRKRVSITLDKNDRKTQKLAEEYLQEKINNVVSTTDVSNLTLAELIDKYLAYQKKNVKQSTYVRNAFCMDFFKKTFGEDTIVKNMNARYIRECLDATDRENSTKNEFLKRLKAMLRWGYQNDYIETVEYLNKLTPYKDNTRKTRLTDKYLEQDEIKKLLAEMNKTNCTVYIDLTEFLILSGLRIGEAISLDKQDVKGQYIPISKNYDIRNNILYDTPKTDPSNRDVYIQDELRVLIDRIHNHNRIRKVSSTFLFCDSDGQRIIYHNYLKFLKYHAMKALGRKITPHTLRHTHASLLIAKGIDVDTVSRRLGHADSKITKEIYIHVMEELKLNDGNKLQNLKLI